MAGSRTKCAHAQEDGVSAGTQQAHQESVGLVAAADDGPGGRVRAEGDDPVQRCDEVGVGRLTRETDRTVDLFQFLRQPVTRQLGFVESLERLDGRQ